MTNQKFYELLQKVTNNFESLNIIELFKAKKELEIEIASEQNKETTSKGRIKKILSHFEKMTQKKPSLNYYTSQIEGFKTITDSFLLVSLKDCDFDGLIFKDEKDQNIYEYPNIKLLANNYYNKYKNDSLNMIFNIKINDLKNKMKLLKPNKKDDFQTMVFENEKGEKVGFSKKELDIFITLLKYNNNDTLILKGSSEVAPFIATNKSGSIGMLLPIRL